jgi:hypothetical protein
LLACAILRVSHTWGSETSRIPLGGILM